MQDEVMMERIENMSDIVLGDNVGQGSFGSVFKARTVRSNDIIAVKKVLNDPKFLNREKSILQLLANNPDRNVIRFFGGFSAREGKAEYDYLCMEFMPMNLVQYIQSFNERQLVVPYDRAIASLYQIAGGLACCHRLNICHRDLKPENVLINVEQGIIKICDFGSAKQLTGLKAGVTYIASRFYRAPELILENDEYTNMIDIWAMVSAGDVSTDEYRFVSMSTSWVRRAASSERCC